MTHTIEPAASGRARCRACGRPIAKGELRLGERLPNPFADEGEQTLWFHLVCGAYKRPEPLLSALESAPGDVERRDWLAEQARLGLEHRRLSRVDGAERASSGRATCRSCQQKIAKDEWRLRLVWFEDGMFDPSGFVHAACAGEYLGTRELLERVGHFSPDLTEADVAELSRALRA